MNLLEIETFLSIVENRSLSKAAEKLFLSQSTVSNRLNVLEEKLNTKLIVRNQGQRFIKLTPKGEEFVDIAKRYVALQKDIKLWANKASPLKLSIGSVDSLNSHLFPQLYNKILKNEPYFKLDISSQWSDTIFNLLESYEIDIALIPQLIKTSNLSSKPIFSENLVVISNPNYSTYDNFISPKDLDKEKEIFFNWGTSFQIWHNNYWNPKDSTNITVDTVMLIFKFINRAEAWAIVPEAIAHSYKQTYSLKISRFIDTPPKRICYKVVHRDPLPRVKKPLEIFESYLKNFIRDNPFLTNVYN